MAKISKKTKKSVSNMTKKFSSPTLNRFMGGDIPVDDTSTTDENKNKEVKSENKTATKIAPLEQGNNFIDMLLKIHSFLQKSHDEDKLNFEKQNNFREENKKEDDDRQRRLLSAIEALAKPGKMEVTAEQEKEQGRSFLDILMDALANISFWKALLKRIPLAALILGAIQAKEYLDDINYGDKMAKNEGNIAQKAFREKITDFSKFVLTQDEAKAILEQPEGKAKERDVSSFGGIKRIKDIAEGKPDPGGILPQQKTYEGLRQEVLPPTVEPRPIGSSGKIKSKQQQWDRNNSADYNPDGTRKSATPVPATTINTESDKQIPETTSVTPPTITAPTSAKMISIDSAPVGEKLNRVQSENNAVKINEMSEPASMVTNSVVQSTAPNKTESLARTDIPAVRNTEETFQKMIYYSTRVV